MKKSVFFAVSGMLFMLLLVSSTNVSAQWKRHFDKFGFDVEFPNTPARVELIVNLKAELTQQTPGFPAFTLLYEKRALPWVIPADIDHAINAHASYRKATVVAGSVSALGTFKGGSYKIAHIENLAGFRCQIFVLVIGNERFLLAVENNGAYAPATDFNKFWNSLNP